MLKLTSLIITNLFILTLFGQIPMEYLYHPFEQDEMPHTYTHPQLQLRQAEKQRIDSVISEPYNIYTQSDVPEKREYTFNDDENITLRQDFTRDRYTQQWVSSTREEYAYDNNENQTLYMYSTWSIYTEQWELDYTFEYTYDNEGHLITRLRSKWDNDTQQSVPYSKIEYTYDDNGDLMWYQSSTWNIDTQQWEQNTQEEYTYDANGALISDLRSVWDTDTQQWVMNTQEEYTYDDNGLLISQLQLFWDVDAQQWIGHKRNEYTYDSEGDLMLHLGWIWNQEWIPQRKYEHTYDSNRNFTVYSYSIWNMSTQEWVPYIRIDYAYDNFHTSEDLITHLSEPYTRHKLTDYILKESIGQGSLVDNKQVTYYYSEQTVGITPAIEAGIKVFPNPTDDIITFDLKNPKSATTISVYDAQGKYIGTQDLQNNQLFVGHLTIGMYFYQLMYKGEMYSGNFIVK